MVTKYGIPSSGSLGRHLVECLIRRSGARFETSTRRLSLTAGQPDADQLYLGGATAARRISM